LTESRQRAALPAFSLLSSFEAAAKNCTQPPIAYANVHHVRAYTSAAFRDDLMREEVSHKKLSYEIVSCDKVPYEIVLFNVKAL
jgi:hypothetical protein